MPKKLDVYGQPAVIPGGVLRQWLPFKWDTATDDPLEIELDRLGIYPSIPSESFKYKGESIKIPSDIYRSYAIDFGGQAHDILTKTISDPQYKRFDDEKKKTKLDKRLNRVKRKTKKRLIKELEQIGVLKRTAEKHSKSELPAVLPKLTISKAVTSDNSQLPKGLTEARILVLLDKYDTTREEIINRYTTETAHA